MYELKEGRKMKPSTFAAMVSNLLYERRFGPFFVEPIVAGIDPKTKEPFICNMDLIGCVTKPEDFVVGGTSDEQLLGKQFSFVRQEPCLYVRARVRLHNLHATG
jgi:20S proteasome subunit beta 3